MILTLEDIEKNIESNDYEKGIEDYAAKKVISYALLSNTDTSLKLAGYVKGNPLGKFIQKINIDKINGTTYINGSCECDVGTNCRHVAAVCIKYTTDNANKINKTKDVEPIKSVKPQITWIDKWINNLQNRDSKEEIYKNDIQNGEYFLTYRLLPLGKHDQNEFQFYRSKIMKSGSISQGSHLDTYKVLNESDSYSFKKNSDDKNIIAMANSTLSQSRYSRYEVKLQGTAGYYIIIEMLKTGRCYFNESKKPLHFKDAAFKPEFHFQLQNEQYILKSNINEKEFKLFETNPALILDIKNNTIQKIDIEIDTYKQLLNAPKIPTAEIGKVLIAIGERIPNIKLKPPSNIITQKIDAQPIPKLHLKYTRADNGKSFNSFKLDFQYNKYSVKYVPREEIQYFYEEDKKVEIRRDLEFEEHAREQIENFGFSMHLANGYLYVFLGDENKQEQLKIWKEFLSTHIPQLVDDGWIVEYDEEFDMKFEPNSNVVVESDDLNNWFSLSFNIEFCGISQPIAPLVAKIIAEYDDFSHMPETINVEVSENHFVELKSKQIQPIIKTIIELFDKKDKDENLKISPYDAHLIEFMDDDVIWRGSKEILELSNKLKDFKGIEKAEPPKCLQAKLREYQQEGLNWLNFLYEFKFGGILADDMGLGKTVQTLAHLSRLKEDGKLTNPSLIVMPTSLISNWKNEVKKFTPNLSVLSLHGNDRGERFDEIEDFDIVLTTYPLIVRDQKRLNEYKFFYIILDEAQKIKNPKTQMAIALKTFKSDYRLALSGTPIENHLGELWSIFSFLMPGFLDTLSFFRTYYQTPIEKERNFERQNLLNKRVKPFMIRRTKEKVAAELPAKSEIIKYTQFDEKQLKLYESIRVTMEKKVREAVEQKGLASSHITILDALLKLRQVCCDPSLLKIEEAQKVHESAKLELLLDLVDELLQEGRKILLFSQFTSMLSIIEEKIQEKNISYTKLTGSTTKREEVIEEFTSGKADIFLISLKAGGVGLNLVEADTVIHYDPWWNPAVENQATDRAYRIGQTKAVFVYKLIVENTIEQKILELQHKKQAIQDGIYDEDKQQEDITFSGNELLELLK